MAAVGTTQVAAIQLLRNQQVMSWRLRPSFIQSVDKTLKNTTTTSGLCVSLTESSVSAQLLVDLLHPLDVEPAGLRMVHHGFWVMDSYDALGCSLHGFGGVPRVVDKLGGKTSEDR